MGPLFTVVLPTKNRPDLAGFVIGRTLADPFPDLELLVVDNDDTAATKEACSKFDDGRLRYVRTGGLNMVENWQRGFDEARGRIMVFIEDKIFPRPGTFSRLASIFANSEFPFITFPILPIDRQEAPSTPAIGFAAGSLRVLESAQVRSLAVRCEMAEYHRLAPRTINTAVVADFAREVHRRCGGLFREVAPDYTSGAQYLRAADRYAHLTEPVTCVLKNAPSIGRSSFVKGAEAAEFFRELGAPWACWLKHVPVPVPLLANSLLNDVLGVWQDKASKLPPVPDLAPDARDYFLLLGSDLMNMGQAGSDAAGETGIVRKALHGKGTAFKWKLAVRAFQRLLHGWPNRRLRARHNLAAACRILRCLGVIPV